MRDYLDVPFLIGIICIIIFISVIEGCGNGVFPPSPNQNCVNVTGDCNTENGDGDISNAVPTIVPTVVPPTIVPTIVPVIINQ